MNLRLSKFQVDLAKMKAQTAIQDAEDRKVYYRAFVVMEQELIEIDEYSEIRLPVLGDLATYLWEKNPKLAEDAVVRLRIADVRKDSRRWKLWVDVKTGTWPVWFHPYSVLVYHEENT